MADDPLALLRDDLDAYEPGDPPDEIDEAPPPEDPLGADRLLRRIRRNERELARLKQIARAEQERITAWLDDRTAGLTSSTEFAEKNLEQWMRSNYEQTGHKTENLPNGVARLRAGRSKVVVIGKEEDAARSLLESHPEWVHTKLSVLRSEVKGVKTGPVLVLDAALAAEAGLEAPPDGFEYRTLADDDGALVACLVQLTPLADHPGAFTYQTAKAEAVTAPAHSAEDTRTEEMD